MSYVNMSISYFSPTGVACLAFTNFHFNQVYFFRPLIIVMFVTYFYGCYLLPFVLALLDFDFLKLGSIPDGNAQPEAIRNASIMADDGIEVEENASSAPLNANAKDFMEQGEGASIELSSGVLPDSIFNTEGN